MLGALGVDVTAYRPALEMLAGGRYPFAELPREVVGFDGLEPLLQRMAGEGAGTPPVHAVFAPAGGVMMRPTFDTFDEGWAERLVGSRPRRGIDGFLGIVVTEVEAGRLVAEMEVTQDVITVMGTMHGGCLSAMCDHVLGVVMYPVMQPGYWAATTEFKVNLLAPVTTGVCRATQRDRRDDASGWRSCASRSRTRDASSPSPRGRARSSRPRRDGSPRGRPGR